MPSIVGLSSYLVDFKNNENCKMVRATRLSIRIRHMFNDYFNKNLLLSLTADTFGKLVNIGELTKKIIVAAFFGSTRGVVSDS